MALEPQKTEEEEALVACMVVLMLPTQSLVLGEEVVADICFLARYYHIGLMAKCQWEETQKGHNGDYTAEEVAVVAAHAVAATSGSGSLAGDGLHNLIDIGGYLADTPQGHTADSQE